MGSQPFSTRCPPARTRSTRLADARRRLGANAVRAAPDGCRPAVPVVAVTGTNGKTTTSRMIGYVAQRAGWSVGWSSTDGIYLNGELIEAGDFSGPTGAGRCCASPACSSR